MGLNEKFFKTAAGSSFPDDPNLELFINFENQVTDQTGNHTTVNSGTTFSTDSKVGTYSGDFDPTADKTLVNDFYLSTTAYSVSFWVKWHSLSTNTWQFVTNLTSRKDQAADAIYIGKYYNQQNIYIRSYASGVEEAVFTPSTNTWYHWVLNVDSSGYKLYVNNPSTPTWSNSTSIASSQVGSTTSAAIGGHVPGIDESMDGKIDQFRVYSRVLTADERTVLYNE
tara:strand:+ start:452 stop:1126 length:675 start_codon:yes stop_codon:yes gene_type:complete